MTELIEIRPQKEWAVMLYGEAVGTVRKLSHNTYGWMDAKGAHKYSDIEQAAKERIRRRFS